MIGPSHLPEPSRERPARTEPLRVAVVTGTRAEFGLLRPVMRAIEAHPTLELLCIAAGAHLIQPAETFREVKAAFPIADTIPMQIAGRTGRYEDAEAVARGIARFSRSFERLRPHWVVVLGDRIEPFAAASAAAIMGFAVAHVHAGDRAEGVADESLRHAITKLAHLHLPATPCSAERIIRMGERPDHVHVVGSPAIDELATHPPLDDRAFAELNSPSVVFLMHPIGRHAEAEEAAAAAVLGALAGERVLALHPNFDAGREGIVRAIDAAGVPARPHLPRAVFVGLLKRLAANTGPTAGALVGNSSAALIEAAALRLPAVDIGPRQHGRERCVNVVHAPSEHTQAVLAALREARAIDRAAITHPYGDGHAAERIAAALAATDPADPALLRKLCTY